MNAIVKYSTGVSMSYSLNAFMPIEGYRLAFNGTEGRLEVRDFERQPWPAPETEIYVIQQLRRAAGDRLIPKAEGGHGGATTCCATWSSAGIDAARAHAPARLARRRHVVPHRHRRAQEHGRRQAGADRRPRPDLTRAQVRLYACRRALARLDARGAAGMVART